VQADAFAGAKAKEKVRLLRSGWQKSKNARHGRRPLQSPERSLCSLAGLKPGRYSGWRDELAATKDGERFIARKKARGDGAAVLR